MYVVFLVKYARVEQELQLNINAKCHFLATLLIKCHRTFDVSNYDSPSQASLSMVASIRAVWASLTSRLLGLNRRWVVATSTGLLVTILIMRVSVQNVQNVLITPISQT